MDILTKINWIDVLTAIIIVRIGYVALQDGLSHEIFPLIGTAATACISARYYSDLAVFVQARTGLPVHSLDLVAFVLLVVCVGLIFKLARALVDILVKVTWHPLVEKFGGLIFGLARASVVVSLLLMMMSLTPLSYLNYSIKERSLSGPYFLKVVPEISGRLAWMFPAIANK
ncbi:MAG: CvpA family protein [Candidatus Omnitrophota bacterium]